MKNASQLGIFHYRQREGNITYSLEILCLCLADQISYVLLFKKFDITCKVLVEQIVFFFCYDN